MEKSVPIGGLFVKLLTMKKAYEIAMVRGDIAHLQMIQTGQPADTPILLHESNGQSDVEGKKALQGAF